MRKRRYPIRMQGDSVKYVNGYVFELPFCDSFSVEIGIHRKGSEWVVSDLNTGYEICRARTRCDAKQLFDEALSMKLIHMILSDDHWPNSRYHTNWYEFKTEEFADLVKGQVG